MKRLLLLCIAAFGVVSAAAGECPNGPLPERPDTLRILGVGNSFTDDGMMYLPDLLREAGIGNVVLARLYFPGCSLEQHCRFYADDAPNYIYYKSTGSEWETVDERATLVQALEDERWDIVVVQQASHLSGLYGSYDPWLEKLAAVILSHNENPGLCLAWQMTWAYAADSGHDGFANYDRDQQRMYEAIVGAVKKMQAAYGIDVLVPTGTAIQNMRLGGVRSLRDMTRDGYHLDLGVGRYTAACTWFDALIAPVLGVPAGDDAFRIPEAGPETTPVTDANAAQCRQAAAAAVESPFAPSAPNDNKFRRTE